MFVMIIDNARLLRLFMRIGAYSGGIPFRDELRICDADLALEDIPMPDDEGGCPENFCGMPAGGDDEDGCSFTWISYPVWKLSLPNSMPAFFRAIPRLKLKDARIAVSAYVNEDAAGFVRDCGAANPDWADRISDDPTRRIEAPITEANMQTLASIAKRHPELTSMHTTSIFRGEHPAHVLLDVRDGELTLDPSIPRRRVAAFAQATGCTYRHVHGDETEDEIFWRMQAPHDWYAFVRALPELFPENHYLTLFMFEGIPIEILALREQYAGDSPLGPELQALDQVSEQAVHFPMDSPKYSEFAEELERCSVDLAAAHLGVCQRGELRDALSSSGMWIDVFVDFPESTLAPWCAQLGMRYRRYVPQPLLRKLRLAWAGKTLD